jgi:hypothetical protein
MAFVEIVAQGKTHMRVLFILWLIAGTALWGDALTMPPPTYDNAHAKVRFLQQRTLYFDQIDTIAFSEISDAAYDAKRKRLYFVGDEGGLFLFDANFGETIHLSPIRAAMLRKKNGKPLKRWQRDSEGMTLDAKGRLFVSFEGEPKVVRLGTEGKDFGRFMRTYKLPKPLRNVKHYRSKNKALEALAYHPRYGLLVAPEWPLKKLHKKCHTIYALRSGKRWCFRAEPEPKSGISAMEVTDEGNVLVLERSFRGFLEPLTVTLKKVYLNRCRKGRCESEVLVKMSTHKGWDIDNFEGLAKVGKNRYIMISDDNENFFQKTLLVYFEVRP